MDQVAASLGETSSTAQGHEVVRVRDVENMDEGPAGRGVFKED